MHARSKVLLTLLAASLGVATGCGPIDKLLGKDTPTPTPGGSGTPTPGGSGTPTPLPTPAQSTSGEITTFDWGTVSLPAGNSPVFTFTAPANAIGVEFLALGPAANANDIFIFYNVKSPTGTVIDNTGGGPEQQAPNTGLAAFPLPASDAAISAVSSGTYKFQVAVFSGTNPNPAIATSPHVLAKVRTRLGGLANNNILKINVVVVAGAKTLLTAANASSDLEVSGAINEMNALYNTVGISVVVDAYYDLSTATFADIGSEAELEQLFLTSSQIPNDFLTVYLINGFSGAFAGGVAGIAGGIPIPNDFNGTSHSGVAIALQGGTGVVTGEDMAHETAHSLGLYHTTEFDGTTVDPISDTPTCPTINTSVNGCPDHDNVMFPQLTGSTTGFTTGQGTVIRPALNVASGASFAPAMHAPSRPALATGDFPRTREGLAIQCVLRHRRFVPSVPLPLPDAE